MDFGDILKDWSEEKENNPRPKKSLVKNRKKQRNSKQSMDQLLDEYSPDKDVLISKEESKGRINKVSKEKLRRKKADLVLDLHGLRADDAKMELNLFIEKSYKCGARKILIIHGKGNHTRGEAVLKPLVRKILDLSPYIGDTGTAEQRDGGSGATWAVVRYRSL